MIGIVVIAYINLNNVFFVKVNDINLLFSEEDKSYTNNLWWPSTTG